MVEGIAVLGHGNYPEDPDSVQYQPKRVANLRNEFVSSISVGCSHAMCLTREGTVYTVKSKHHLPSTYNSQWGVNNRGQCGTGDTIGRSTPTRIGFGEELDTAASVACGEHHSAIITSQGYLLMFGNSDYGQVKYFPYFDIVINWHSLQLKLGLGDRTEVHSPTRVMGIPAVWKVSCGVNHSAFITSEFV